MVEFFVQLRFVVTLMAIGCGLRTPTIGRCWAYQLSQSGQPRKGPAFGMEGRERDDSGQLVQSAENIRWTVNWETTRSVIRWWSTAIASYFSTKLRRMPSRLSVERQAGSRLPRRVSLREVSADKMDTARRRNIADV